MYSWRRIPLFFLLAISLFGSGRALGDKKPYVKEPEEPAYKPLSVAEAIAVLEKSADVHELSSACASLAHSSKQSDRDRLTSFLLEISLWERIPAREDLDLAMRRMLRAVATSPNGEVVLLSLAQSNRFFLGETPGKLTREQALILLTRDRAWFKACAQIDRPSSKLLAFLDAESCKRTSRKRSAIDTLVEIGTKESATIVEKRIGTPEWQPYGPVGTLLYQRNKKVNVDLMRRLLTSRFADSEGARHALVRALFFQHQDLSPDRREHVIAPPPRNEAPTDVLTELVVIADMALKLDIPQETKTVVVREKKEIQRLLDFRRAKGPERVKRLIADFDSDSFSIRETAEKELEKIGDLAELELKRALKADPSQEARRRLERLLDKIAEPVSPPEK